MSHYKSNLRDIEFNLFEVLGATRSWARVRSHEIDAESAREILAEVERLAREDLAASFVDADRNPPVFDPETHTVTMPESLQEELPRAGWTRSSGAWRSPKASAAPPPLQSLRWAWASWCSAPTPPILHVHARARFRRHPLPPTATSARSRSPSSWSTGSWGATMVLTEPDAGSDVGAGRAKAFDNGDGTWNIEGVKRFITSASTT
jgi:alkylation response protein AidB-like acyl-CoA dehydrogenase